MFPDDVRARASAFGIDVEQSYLEFLHEIKVGGPVMIRLARGMEMQHVSRVTKREAEVLSCFADGGSHRTIAARLGITRETAKSHTRTIRIKMDARNTTHAVAIAIREGII